MGYLLLTIGVFGVLSNSQHSLINTAVVSYFLGWSMDHSPGALDYSVLENSKVVMTMSGDDTGDIVEVDKAGRQKYWLSPSNGLCILMFIK